MMISPEVYYEIFLKGKDEKQIMTAVRGIKQEIGSLKNIMEDSTYGEEMAIHPSEEVRLWCNRLYLERAKEALVEVGGTYKPSKAELKVASFDNSVPNISKVVFEIGGFCNGQEIRTITIDGDNIYMKIEHSPKIKENDEPSYCDYAYSKEEFIEGIKKLHLGEWRRNYYDNDICDGTQWELTIEFADGHKTFKSCGSNEYPYNFYELQVLLGID